MSKRKLLVSDSKLVTYCQAKLLDHPELAEIEKGFSHDPGAKINFKSATFS